MMNKIKQPLRKLLLFARQYYRRTTGYDVECNICGFPAKKMLSDGWHDHSICEKCFSGVRQRLLWAALNYLPDTNVSKLIAGKKVIHFAPEKFLGDRIREYTKQYFTADYLAESYTGYGHLDFVADISDMKNIADDCFDCLIACDVLEHVIDDNKALSEIRRVLSPGGVAILTVPQKDGLEKTIEDLSDLTPEEREEKFGQFNHYRIYGSDFEDNILSKGFNLRTVTDKDFDEEITRKNVLKPPVISTRPLATNYRKVFFAWKK